jgi:hypothetical protein
MLSESEGINEIFLSPISLYYRGTSVAIASTPEYVRIEYIYNPEGLEFEPTFSLRCAVKQYHPPPPHTTLEIILVAKASYYVTVHVYLQTDMIIIMNPIRRYQKYTAVKGTYASVGISVLINAENVKPGTSLAYPMKLFLTGNF